MRHRIRRNLGALLAVLLLALPVLGCAAQASFNVDGYPICDVPIRVEAAVTTSTKDPNSTTMVKYIREALGIDVNFTVYDSSMWQTQITLMMASDELPDLLLCAGLDKAQANIYGEEGFFLDMSQYMDLMPNYQAFCRQTPGYAAYNTSETGAVYSLSRAVDSHDFSMQMFTHVRYDWLENVGMEMPTTVDEFYDVLVAFKQQDANGNGDPNDEIPLSFNFTTYYNMDVLLKAAFGVYSYARDYNLQADGEGKVYLAETTDNWKAYLTFMHKLYAEGLLDNTVFIQTAAELDEKLTNNTIGFFGTNNSIAVMRADTASADLKVYHDYAHFAGLTSAYTDEITVPMQNMVRAGAATLISAKTEYPEALIRLMDWTFTEDGIMTTARGVEGTSYYYIEDDFGNTILETKDLEAGWTDGNWGQQTQYVNGALSHVVYTGVSKMVASASDERLAQYMTDPERTQYIRHANFSNIVRRYHTVWDYPLVTYVESEAQARSTLKTDITTYLESMKAQFITGELDINSHWDTFLSTLSQMELDRLLSIEQAALDRYFDANQ